MRDSVEVGWEIAHLARPGPIALRLALCPRRRILTYPDVPSRYQALYKLCAVNGYRIVKDPEKPHDLAFHFQYQLQPCELPLSKPTVNRGCGDVSKRRVAEVFEEIFGYKLAISPTLFEGLMVEKPNGNHTFDGRVLQGPIKPDDIMPDRVYERHIDTADNEEAVDLRTVIYGQEIPIVYEKRRPKSGGLKDNTFAKIRDPEEVFSSTERSALLAFSEKLQLDYGELDVLRDVNDNRIYVVDVNNTPAGPPKQMSDADIAEALKILSPSFERLLERVEER
ncbi:hypothetical protein PARPLA_03288 [Rhodobacteraceae bacterium THAF1]|nr:hypothetical protein FIU81_16940 [Palleronia sp. THAF1]VDC31395.1 hypothetical protein PARPLA_03288 [Rhodobacteraceae bacterium THAF1]